MTDKRTLGRCGSSTGGSDCRESPVMKQYVETEAVKGIFEGLRRHVVRLLGALV